MSNLSAVGTEKTYRSTDNVIYSVLLLAASVWGTLMPLWDKPMRPGELAIWKAVVSEAPEWQRSGRSSRSIVFSVLGFPEKVYISESSLMAMRSKAFIANVNVGDTLTLGPMLRTYAQRIQRGNPPGAMEGTSVQVFTVSDAQETYLSLDAYNFYKKKDSWLGTIFGPMGIAAVVICWRKRKRLDQVPKKYFWIAVPFVLALLLLWPRFFRFEG